MKEKKNALFSDLLFLAIILILLWVSFQSFKRIEKLNNDFAWVDHSNLVKLKLEQLLSSVKDGETAQRGFLLTNDTTYLLPLADGIKNSFLINKYLDSITSDNKPQHQKTLELAVLIEERFDRLHSNKLLINEPKDSLIEQLQIGKDQMIKIRTLIKYMIENENHLLAERTKEKDQTASITPRYSLILSLIAILIVILAYFKMRAEKTARFRAEDSEATIQNFFMQVPAMVAILKGANHKFQFINPSLSELLGKSGITGKPLLEALPELNDSTYLELLNEVYKTGTSFNGKEMKIPFQNKKTGADIYINLVLQSYENTAGEKEGILVFCYDVSELVITRKKIEELELRSRLAIEAAEMGTFDWDLQNQKFNSSPRLTEIFGFGNKAPVPHSELISRFHPYDKAVRDKAVEDASVKGSLEYEARVIWPDGSIHWINVFGKMIHNDEKQAVRIYGTVIDITKQKKILNELRESESKFRLLADSMPQLIWTGNAEGKLNYFNNAVYEYSGLTAAELETSGWISIVHPEDKTENINRWQNAVSTGSEFKFEHRFKKKNGEYRWQLSRAIPQRNMDGKIEMWVGTSTDIDEQKNYSRKLQEKISERTKELAQLNEELLLRNNIFAQAEKNALIGSYSWSMNSGELNYSDNLFRLLGYEPGDFIPSFEKYLEFVHPEDRELASDDGKQTIESRQLVERVHRIIKKDGNIRYFRSSGNFFGEGDNISLIGSIQDITHDTLLNEMLRSQNVALERSNAELESFNYIASHDLQEPLRKIQAFSDRILEKENDVFSENTRDYFKRITNAASRMQNLIDALISYSKTNISGANTVKTDLNKLMATVLEGLQDNIDDKKATIHFSNLPVVETIPSQFQQLFTNLISNAIKYSKKEEAPLVKIDALLIAGKQITEFAANPNLNYWKISVQDNGIGFDQKYSVKIFDLFQRLHGSTEYLGTGIGLAICSKIMRNHEGHITAIGNPGIGATFNILLPAID